MTTVFKIKSKLLAAEGCRIEGSDERRMRARLDVIQRQVDPKAYLLKIPVER